jgi:glycosyltransferase involved in cell wall biosynthesis
VIATVHDFIITRDVPRLRLPGKVYGRYFAWAVGRATHVITDSDFTKQEALRLAHCQADHITTVLLGVNRSAFQPLPAEALVKARARLGLPAEFILYTGTLELRKGSDVLLQAFARLTIRFPNLRLVLTGFDQWPATPYYSQARELGMADKIKHLGFVNRLDMPAVFNLARAFIFPSRLEGFGMPVLEAMACGTPVISSNAASLPEVAGDACILIPPDDVDALVEQVTNVLSRPDRASELRLKGLERAAQLNWEETARRTLAVYEHVAQPRLA